MQLTIGYHRLISMELLWLTSYLPAYAWLQCHVKSTARVCAGRGDCLSRSLHPQPGSMLKHAWAQVVDMAEHSPDRQTRAAAVECLHAVILWIVGEAHA